jgi:acetyl esterase/lipase
VCALADYRIATVHGTTPDRCVEDAKSAVRWVRAHAAELGADPEKLISAGGSSGGHLAAAVALVPGFDAPGDNPKISSVPNAMVLFNPGLNFLPVPGAAKQYEGVVDATGAPIAAKISPLSFLKRGAPPTVIFFGTADEGLDRHGRQFLAKARELGNRCELWTAAGQPHGFFNKQPWTSATAIQADKFLASLGYLQGAPTLPPADAQAVLVQVK